jgi:long-chain acyl-CoA synthetase
LLFNAFPLPRNAGFRRSFTHAGEALNRGMHVLIFPEGHRSRTGALMPFQSGIGLLVQESGVPVLPLAFGKSYRQGDGLRKQRGHITIHVGTPLSMGPDEDAKHFTARLSAAVAALRDQASSRAASLAK